MCIRDRYSYKGYAADYKKVIKKLKEVSNDVDVSSAYFAYLFLKSISF